MLRWILIFCLVSIVAGVLGFSGIAAQAAGMVRILFFIFIVLFAASVIMHFFKVRK